LTPIGEAYESLDSGATIGTSFRPRSSRIIRCIWAYCPKRQGPVAVGMKKAAVRWSKPGSKSFFSMSPVVVMNGRHSRPEANCRPISIVRSSDSGSGSDG